MALLLRNVLRGTDLILRKKFQVKSVKEIGPKWI